MRLTTLCVCGTLLAFSSWIRAEEGPLQGDRGVRPCAASLRLEGACRPGQHDGTCPYLLNLPPLTIHLPRHLREVENIMQDLKKLKDSVDELRKMCADCTESRTERRCGVQREKELGKQNEGKSEDVGSGMNVSLEERDFKHEHGNDGEEGEKTDGDDSTEKSWILEWETDRKSIKEAVKDNKGEEEDPTELTERDRKQKKESAGGLEQKKVPAAGGNTRMVDVTSEEAFETTHGETKDLLDALKGNLKGFQEDMLENEEEEKMSTGVKNKEKTKEDGDLYVWRDEINRIDKKTKTEAGDRIKMSENHENREENINKEREQHREETRKEEGIKVDQNNEKLKHTESTRQTEKEKAIKEGEVDEKGREMGTGIKTKSVQRNSDGALSWRKTTEGTDFLSISPTPTSTTTLASKPDPNNITIFTSSLPSPPSPSSTLSSITDVSRDTKDVYGPTPGTGLGAADISEAESREADLSPRTTAPGGDRQEITSKTTGFNSGAGLQDHERSTTTAPHQKLNTTASPRVTDHRRWTPKKNISSNIKTGLKLPPGRVLRPGDKRKPGIKPEAEQKQKNPKNDRKPNQAPAPDKKTKYIQKQKPAPPRATSEKSKPGKDSENIHISKPDQKTTPPILATDKNWKNNLTHPSPQNKLLFQKPKPSIHKPAPQRPQTVQTSHSGKDPSNNKKQVLDETPIIDQNSKSETRLVHSFTTNKPDQTETHKKETENEEKTKLDEKESDSKTKQTESFTPKPKQQHLTESVETSDKDRLQEPESRSNIKPGQKITSNTVNVSFDQINKSSQEIPERKHKPVQEPKIIKSETATAKPLSENVKKSDENPLEEPESNLDLISGQKFILNQVNETSDQTNKSSQEISKIKPKPIKEPTSKIETAAPKHNQKPSAESVIKSNKNIVQEPESNPDLSGQKTTSDQVNATSDQVNTSSQRTRIKQQPKFKQWPKTHKSESGTTNPKQKTLTEHKSADKPETESNRETFQIKPKPNQKPKPKTEPARLKPVQKPSTESVVDENPLQNPKSNQDLNNGQLITSNTVNATSDEMTKTRQEISKTKPKTKPKLTEGSKTETAAPKADQKPSSGQKITSGQLNATSDQVNTSNQEIPKIKQPPKFKQWPKTNKSESGKLNPKQKPLPEDKSTENPLSIQDLNNEQTITSTGVTADSDQMPEFSQEVLNVKHKPKSNQEPEPKNETATPKPDYTPSTESEVDENPLQEPESNKHLNNEQTITSNRVKTTSVQMPESTKEILSVKHKPKPSQELEPKTETATPKPDQNTSTESDINENPLQEPESSQDLNNEWTIISSPVTAISEQTPEFSREIFSIKHKPQSKKQPEPKTETATSKPDQNPPTEYMVDENPFQETKSNQDLNNEWTITSSPVTAIYEQTPEFSQEIFSIKHKPQSKKQPEPKTETATSKPGQHPSTESVVNEDSVKVPESNQDLNNEQTITSSQVKTTSDQMPESSKEILIVQHKPRPSQESEPNTETATSKPDQNPSTEYMVNENPFQETKSNQDLNNEWTITSSSVTVIYEQTPEFSQEIFSIKHKPKSKKEHEPKTERVTPKPGQNPYIGSEVNENPLHEPESDQDLNYEQTITSNQVKTNSDQKPESSHEILSTKPKPIQEHEPKTETVTPEPAYNPSTESVVDESLLQKPESKQELLPEKETNYDQVDATLDQITDSNQEDLKFKHKPNPNKEPKSKKSETATLGPDWKSLKESAVKSEENPLQEPEFNKDSTSGPTHAADKAKKVPVQKFKPNDNSPIINKRPKPGPEPKQNQKHPKPVTGLKNKPNLHTERVPPTDTSFKAPRPDQNPKLKLFFKPKNIPTAKTNGTLKPRPPFQQRPLTRPWIRPGAKPIQRPKPPMRPKPSLKTKTRVDPPKISWAPPKNIPNSQTETPSTFGSATQISEVTHSPKETDFSTRKTVTLGPKTSDSLESRHFPHLHTHTEDFTLSPNSRIASDLRPQTASQPPSIPMTTRSDKTHRGTLQRVISSTNPGSTQPSPVPKSDFRAQDKTFYTTEETAPANLIFSPSLETASTPSPDFRSMTRTTSGPEPLAAELTTPSARELRVKINQVAAYINNNLNPKGGPVAGLPKQHLEGSQRGSRPDTQLPTSVQTKVMRDCSDHRLRGETRSGVYLVTPDLRSSSFQVFCDMERDGGGWTLLQRRQDGSVSFNRTWAEYQSGFGVLDGGEFWLGNRMIHLLTRDRDMMLRVELEDFEGVTEHAQYEQFKVAGERQRYRLTVGGYSGTAGDALRFSKRYDHNNRAFTTPDRDHDRYPSGNCGAYYSSGWWFDACMAANLNGKYYIGHYKGVRNGIFWGTWHNISTEYYPTNERQSFKSVRMMIRPKSFAP